MNPLPIHDLHFVQIVYIHCFNENCSNIKKVKKPPTNASPAPFLSIIFSFNKDGSCSDSTWSLTAKIVDFGPLVIIVIRCRFWKHFFDLQKYLAINSNDWVSILTYFAKHGNSRSLPNKIVTCGNISIIDEPKFSTQRSAPILNAKI